MLETDNVWLLFQEAEQFYLINDVFHLFWVADSVFVLHWIHFHAQSFLGLLAYGFEERVAVHLSSRQLLAQSPVQLFISLFDNDSVPFLQILIQCHFDFELIYSRLSDLPLLRIHWHPVEFKTP